MIGARAPWRWLRAHPVHGAVLAGLLVASPTLALPLTADDFLQQLALRAYWDGEAPLDIFHDAVDRSGLVNVYHFMHGDTARTARHRYESRLPWWTLDELRIDFYRPLSSLALSADYHLWPGWAPGYRLHTFVWLAALLAMYALILRGAGDTSSLWALALLLITITDKHFMVVAWIANRHALVAAAPAALGLWAYLRWRRDGWTPGAFIAPAGMAMGLAGGETALSMTAFVFSYETLGAPRRRLLAMLPVAAVVGLWALHYTTAGYGTYGSGYYLNPASEPLAFFTEGLMRAPVLLLGEFGGILSELWFGVALRPMLFVLGLVTIAVVSWVLRSAWPELTAHERSTTRWLGVGGLLALIPCLAAQPADRLLLVPELGLGWVLAVVLRHAWRARGRSRPLAAYGYLLALRHTVAAPLGWLVATGLFGAGAEANTEAMRTLTLPPNSEQRPAGVFVASDPGLSVYLPSRRLLEEQPIPHRWFVWSMAPQPHRLRRIDERTLELTCLQGGMLDPPFAQLFRSDAHPLFTGQIIQLDQHRVEVGAMSGDELRSIIIHLDTPPEEWIFLTQVAGGLQTLALPEVGKSIELPFQPGPLGL